MLYEYRDRTFGDRNAIFTEEECIKMLRESEDIIPVFSKIFCILYMGKNQKGIPYTKKEWIKQQECYNRRNIRDSAKDAKRKFWRDFHIYNWNVTYVQD